MDFRTTPLVELVGDVAARRVSAGARRARTRPYRRAEPPVNAFVAVDADGALSAADEVDRRVAAGEDVGRLAGIPIGVKDLEDAVGFVTTNGSATPRTMRLRRATRCSCHASGRRVRSSSARPTRPNSASSLRPTTPPSASPATRGISNARPVGRRAGRRLRSPQAWCRSQPGPMAVGRSVSRRRRPQCRGSSRRSESPHCRPGSAGMAPPLHPWSHGPPHSRRHVRARRGGRPRSARPARAPPRRRPLAPCRDESITAAASRGRRHLATRASTARSEPCAKRRYASSKPRVRR